MSDSEILFNAHTHHFLRNERGIVQLTTENKTVLPPIFSVGIHPENAKEDCQAELDWVNEVAHNNSCLAIGEIGLDTRYSNKAAQERVYIEQLKIAERLQKPVILHCVNSWDRCKFLHHTYASATPLIFHGFNKTRIIAQVLDYPPAVISFGVSLQTNSQLKELAKQIPLNRILLETDNQPDGLKSNYSLLAELKNLSLQTLINELSQNAKRIFNYE